MSARLLSIEKLYKEKYKEEIPIISEKRKTISNIEDLEISVKSEEINKENYTIVKPLRNVSIFSNKCKYCNNPTIKEIDNTYYLKYNSCYKCYVLNEESRNGR